MSASEREWIKIHPVIVCAPDPDFPPAEFFNSHGQYQGLVADYLDSIFNRVGLKKKIVRLEKWSDVLEHAREKKIDLVTAATKTAQRQVFLNFSDPYLEIPSVIIARQQVNQELTLTKLKKMKVSVVNRYASHDYIAKYHPDLHLDLVPDIQTGLRKVSFGIVDAMVANIASVSHYIEKGRITNLKVAGEINFTYRLSFAPRKDWPELTQILNKGLASLSEGEKREIYTKWIHLERFPILSKKMVIFLVFAVGIIFLLIAIVMGWNKTLRRAVEEKTRALKKSEEKLSGIIHSINDHMVMLDRDLNILWANHSAIKHFGDDLENKKCHFVFAGLQQPCDDCIAKLCFLEGQMQEREMCLKQKDGSRLDFRETINAASLKPDGHPKTVVAIFRDITRRKALAAEAMRAGHLASIGELAAGVAHEINNPINSIINLAQIILNDDKKKGEHNDMALRVINEGTRIADIVNGLLAFAKDQHGTKMMVNLKNIVWETLALTDAQIIKNGIELVVEMPGDLPMVFAHFQQIQQVFLNLINNARFALNKTPLEQGISKTISIKGTVSTLMGISCIKIIFEDNGPGISEKIIDRILEPFFTTKTGGQGTGLGLSISHGIISDHQGRMTIESKEGEYTRVIIDLPAGGRA